MTLHKQVHELIYSFMSAPPFHLDRATSTAEHLVLVANDGVTPDNASKWTLMIKDHLEANGLFCSRSRTRIRISRTSLDPVGPPDTMQRGSK